MDGVERLLRLHSDDGAGVPVERPFGDQRFTGPSNYVHMDGLTPHGRCRFRKRPGGASGGGTIRPPNQIAGADAGKPDRAVGEQQTERAVAMGDHLIDASAFLGFFRTAPRGRVENHAIPGSQRRNAVRRGGFDPDARRFHGRTLPMATPR